MAETATAVRTRRDRSSPGVRSRRRRRHPHRPRPCRLPRPRRRALRRRHLPRHLPRRPRPPLRLHRNRCAHHERRLASLSSTLVATQSRYGGCPSARPTSIRSCSRREPQSAARSSSIRQRRPSRSLRQISSPPLNTARTSGHTTAPGRGRGATASSGPPCRLDSRRSVRRPCVTLQCCRRSVLWMSSCPSRWERTMPHSAPGPRRSRCRASVQGVRSGRHSCLAPSRGA
mmetsp:Transcript_24309/g.66966  ORF Transcript_24309/g.66966 Transcript_24309/m.66966 type:complete len:230 (-) Transcript_24309:1086-1775(-)